MRKPSREEMARDHRERQKAHRAQRLEEARRGAEMRTGNTEAIDGRIRMPGEPIGVASIGSQENITGVEESQWLTGGKGPWGEA